MGCQSRTSRLRDQDFPGSGPGSVVTRTPGAPADSTHGAGHGVDRGGTALLGAPQHSPASAVADLEPRGGC